MKIELFEREKPSLDQALKAHTLLIEHYQGLTRMQSRCETRYWLYLGAFLLACLGFIILCDRGVVDSSLIGIVFAGLGAMSACLLNAVMDFQYRREAADCIKQGRVIEADIEYEIGYFGIFESNSQIMYWCGLVNRLLPIGVIGVSTLIAGALLVLKTVG